MGIHSIGCKEIMPPQDTRDRTADHVYKCSRGAYPELIEDLILTGYHALLVPALKYEEREEMERLYGKMYNTDGLYRLPVCADKRSEIYRSKKKMTIYNFALESEDIYRNYGIYANGLLVENCSINYLNNRSQMTNQYDCKGEPL